MMLILLKKMHPSRFSNSPPSKPTTKNASNKSVPTEKSQTKKPSFSIESSKTKWKCSLYKLKEPMMKWDSEMSLSMDFSSCRPKKTIICSIAEVMDLSKMLSNTICNFKWSSYSQSLLISQITFTEIFLFSSLAKNWICLLPYINSNSLKSKRALLILWLLSNSTT